MAPGETRDYNGQGDNLPTIKPACKKQIKTGSATHKQLCRRADGTLWLECGACPALGRAE